MGGLLSVTACRGGNVLLGDAIAAAPSPQQEPRDLRLYYDRDGDLYPGKLLPVATPNAGFLGLPHRYRLQRHFELSLHNDPPGFWEGVLDSLKLSGSGDSLALWTAVQDSLNARAVSQLRELLQSGNDAPPTLVVMIHGFNNNASDADGAYAVLQDTLVRGGYVNSARTVFLKIFWDGLTNDVGIPIWGEAQFNFPLVGLAFRRVLNKVPHDVPVRIFTHSSGAPLIVNTLWNAAGSLEDNSDTQDWLRYKFYLDHIDDSDGTWGRPSHPDMRVAMIVPAMPGLTFINVEPSDPSPARLIIGVNPHDLAITKFGWIPVSWKFWTLTCAQGGSTCLAAYPADYCVTTRQKLGASTGMMLRIVDFSKPTRMYRDPRSLYLLDRHGVEWYLRRPQMRRVLEWLFRDGSDDPGDDRSWCRTATNQ